MGLRAYVERAARQHMASKTLRETRDQNADSLNIESSQVSPRQVKAFPNHDSTTVTHCFDLALFKTHTGTISWICVCHMGVFGFGAARKFYEVRRTSPCKGSNTTIAVM